MTHSNRSECCELCSSKVHSAGIVVMPVSPPFCAKFNNCPCHTEPNGESLHDCSGCTDRHSEGTHQLHTKQHPCPEGGDPNCGYCFPDTPSQESEGMELPSVCMCGGMGVSATVHRTDCPVSFPHTSAEKEGWEQDFKESTGIFISEYIEERFGIIGKHVPAEDIPDYFLQRVREILASHTSTLETKIEGAIPLYSVWDDRTKDGYKKNGAANDPETGRNHALKEVRAALTAVLEELKK